MAEQDPYSIFNIPTIQGIGNQLIPGYYPGNIPSMNWEGLHNLFLSQMGGGGGAGSGGGGAGGGFLNDLWSNIDNIGQMDPTMLGNIDVLSDQVGQNYDQFQGLLTGLGGQYTDKIGGTGDSLMKYIMGLGPDTSRGGGGFSFGPGGGGGGYTSEGSIQNIWDQIPEFQARDIRTDLPELDPRLAAEMQQIRDAQLNEFESFREDQTGALMADLFGRGVQRSTVAGEASDRASRSLEQTRLDIVSEDISRRLGIRKEEADRILAADLGSLQTEGATYGDRVRALTGIKTADIGAKAQAASAASAAGASAAASRSALLGNVIQGLSSIYGSQTSGLSSLFGNQAQGLTSGFGTQQGALTNFADLWGNLALGGAGQEIEKYLGAGQLAASDLASRRSAGVARQGNQIAQLGQYLDLLRFQESVAGRFQQGLFGIPQMAMQNQLGMGELQNMKDAAPGDLERIIAALGGIMGIYSDYRQAQG